MCLCTLWSIEWELYGPFIFPFTFHYFTKNEHLHIELQYPISFLRIAWISAGPSSRTLPKGTPESTSLAANAVQ